MNTETNKAAEALNVEMIGGRLFSTVVWSHVGVAVAFLALALLSATHQHVALAHLASGITHIG